MRYLHRQTNLQFPVMHKPGSVWSLRGTLVENFLGRLEKENEKENENENENESEGESGSESESER